MNKEKTPSEFHHLTPQLVIDRVEEVLGEKCTSLCRPYTSYINRVYELSLIDGTSIVAKFYRPGRWSREALQDEHDFLSDLAKEEVPVIAPLTLKNGETLAEHDGMFFALFPKKGGRNRDEFTDDEWLTLGRLLGRVHAIGALRMPKDRIILTPKKATQDHLTFILNGGFIPANLATQFQEISATLLESIDPLFQHTDLIRIHGDCHYANIIHRPDEHFSLIDFDDMAIGPPIQDVWMLLPGYKKDSMRELNLFIEGYETFRSFDMHNLQLIEPLRAMRYIHYTAWCAHQVADGGFSRIAPQWGTSHYWQQEIHDLHDQLNRIQTDHSPNGNVL